MTVRWGIRRERVWSRWSRLIVRDDGDLTDLGALVAMVAIMLSGMVVAAWL